jgi:uncharacterized protein (TIGR02444 family)
MRDADPLWQFAVERYAVPSVRRACLRLQDEHGFDVDVVLACLWMATRGVALPREDLRALLREVEPIAHWVRRLRGLRREASEHARRDPAWEPVADATRAAELSGEARALQLMYGRLASQSSGLTSPPAAALQSLLAYAEILGVSDAAADFAALTDGLDTDPP